jgi:hypothetical protein
MTSSTGGSGDALRHAERFKICASSVEALKSGLTALLALEIEIGLKSAHGRRAAAGFRGGSRSPFTPTLTGGASDVNH